MSAINVKIMDKHLVVTFADTCITFGKMDDNHIITTEYLKEIIKNVDSITGSKCDWHIKLIYIYLKNKFDEIFEMVKDLHKKQHAELYTQETLDLCNALYTQILRG